MTTVSATTRHRLVLGGVVLSILGGMLAVRAASAWADSSAPLDATPVSAESITAALVSEQERAAALQAELRDMTDRSTELANELAAATARVADDAATATDLRARLAAAELKLKRLQASLTTSARSNPSGRSPTTASSSGKGRDEEHEDEPAEHDDD